MNLLTMDSAIAILKKHGFVMQDIEDGCVWGTKGTLKAFVSTFSGVTYCSIIPTEDGKPVVRNERLTNTEVTLEYVLEALTQNTN